MVELRYRPNLLVISELVLLEYTLKDKLWLNYEPEVNLFVESVPFITFIRTVITEPPAFASFMLKIREPTKFAGEKKQIYNLTKVLI